uniref:protein-serine/threonine phosphatase n=1 Tax=Entamoeba invadens TaxID=33085 RepID=S0B3J8_ENTIV|nr:serine/threonine protein phosphatase PP2A catalytic subunit, putative [Entamoeba invadens]
MATNLEECILKLNDLEVLHEDVVKEVCRQFTLCYTREQNVVPITGPVTIVGCLNGQLHDLQNIFNIAGKVPYSNYLFLGDYVNFGQYGLELYVMLMCYKVLHPNRLTLLRGMNEIQMFSEVGGFHSECYRKYGNDHVYKMIVDTFNYLPLAADVQGQYFCTHGGVLPNLTVSNIQVFPRVKNMKQTDMLTYFLITQSREEKYLKYFKWFERTGKTTFSEADVETFLKNNTNAQGKQYQKVINTNSLQPLGQIVSDNQKMMTIWSAANFVGEFNNLGCFLEVDVDGSIKEHQFCAPPVSAMPPDWKPLRDELPRAVPDFFS